MGKLRFLITFLFITIPLTKIISQNDSIIAVTELNRLNERYGYKAQVTITRQGSIISLPDQKIQISLDELKRISSIDRKDIRFYVVRFIVAHEFAHQIQYYTYRDNAKYMNNDLVSKTIIETQADILAGLMFFTLNPELMTYMSKQPELVDEVLQELFRVAIAMGSKENTLGSHPSKRERMLALRLGLTNGYSFLYDQMIKGNSASAMQNGITPEIFKKQMEAQFEYIDLKQDEEMLSWSYRQAKKIVNYDRKIATDIVLITPSDQRHTFHTENSYPFVDYNLTYKNIGKRSIDVEMEIFVALISREDPNSGETFRKLNVNHYKFTLAPSETKTLNDKLSWLKNKNELADMKIGEMPRIVYPSITSSDAIYSCNYSNDVTNKVYQENIKSLGFANSNDEFSFSIFFNSIINAYLSKDRDLIQCIGEVSKFNPNKLYYICSYQFEAGTKTSVLTDIQRNIIKIEMEYPNYVDRIKILKKFDELKRQLDIELDQLVKKEGQDKETLWVTYKGNSYKVYLEVYTDIESSKNSIYFSINFNH